MSFNDDKKRMYLQDYAFTPKVEEAGPAKPVKPTETKVKAESITDPETDSSPEKPVYLVNLFNGKFEEPEEGFDFNKECKVSIQATLPKECKHYRVEFRLFSIYKEKVENLYHQKEGTSASGTTDGQGNIRFECDKNRSLVKFEYNKGKKTIVRGFFPRPAPIDTDDGIWQRLVNLGYWDQDKATLSPKKEQLQAVIQAFQMDFEILATGVLDPKTQDKLVELSSSSDASGTINGIVITVPADSTSLTLSYDILSTAHNHFDRDGSYNSYGRFVLGMFEPNKAVQGIGPPPIYAYNDGAQLW